MEQAERIQNLAKSVERLERRVLMLQVDRALERLRAQYVPFDHPE